MSDPNDGNNNSSNSRGNNAVQSMILGLATLTMILLGLSVVLFVMLCPLLEFVLLIGFRTHIHGHYDYWWLTSIAVFVVLQAVHLWLLWTSVLYLSLFRKLVFPVRYVVMTLVPLITKIECIREPSSPYYLDLDRVRATRGSSQRQGGQVERNSSNTTTTNDNVDNGEEDDLETLMRYFRRQVRKQYKKVKKAYRDDHIRCESYRSEDTMRLCDVVPLMWEHERRLCLDNNKAAVAEEFLKRFLVVTLTTNATLDLYYDADDTLCAMLLSYVQGSVLHNMMYFAINTQSGILFHACLNGMIRAMRAPSVRYLNLSNHNDRTKRNAGLVMMELDDPDLSDIFPMAFTSDIPADVRYTELWEGIEVTVPASNDKRQQQRQRQNGPSIE